ncbi:MAG TPA: polyprenyl synthetase family protein [Acidimicrobiales bacterium]
MSALHPTSDPGAPPDELRVVGARVEQRITDLLDAEQARWELVDAGIVAPLESLRRLVMAGGKRLRPTFCHWGHVAAGGDPDDIAVVEAGAALELLQAFALVHDDVMDGSATRRGAPSVHHQFAATHESSGWRGEGRRFGEGVAILVGDLAHVYADQLLPAGRPDVDEVWHELRIELNVGQYLDMVGTAERDVSRTTARRVARYKSGKYTIERPLHLGAALAGRYHDCAPSLSAYGDPLGEAFQLRDDVLGVFGESERTGKPVGDDLREGKPTLLLSVATERCPSADRPLLDRVGAGDLAPDEVVALQELFVTTGAVAEVEATIEALTGRATEAASAIGDRETQAALTRLAHFVSQRTA